jgi:hypothetical protein
MSDTTVCACPFRKKIAIAIIGVLDEAECGVPDSELIDILDTDLAGPDGKPVLRIRYCPWCGKSAPKPERITDIASEDSEDNESWRGEPEDE